VVIERTRGELLTTTLRKVYKYDGIISLHFSRRLL